MDSIKTAVISRLFHSNTNRVFSSSIKVMPGVKCLNCGHVMDRVESATYIATSVFDRYINRAVSTANKHAIHSAFGVADKGLSGACNGLQLTCPRCGNKSSFTPN